MKWRRLTAEAIDNLPAADVRNQICIARRTDGKCCVGQIAKSTDRNVTIRNGNYEVTLWYMEPRMFILIEPPQPPVAEIGEPKLKL